MKKIKYSIYVSVLILLAGLFAFPACNDKWDDHYDENKNVVGGKTLWENILANPDLSTFSTILQKYGYDRILSQSQMYTVWAPVNSALVNMDLEDEDIEKELINNHIARSAVSTGFSGNKRVYMLNNKVLSFLNQFPEGYSLGGISLTGSHPEVSNNGLLYTLGGYAPFLSNIWEFLEKDSELSSITTFLYSFDEITLDIENSVEGDIDEDGNIVYLDSVLINSNIMFYQIGHINREDSSYTMILPTNTAWEEAYDRIKEYYVFSNRVENADSLQDYYTKYALVQDLVFNDNRQVSPTDSLVSTRGNVFYEPEYLFEGYKSKETLSNGTVYITDKLKYNAWESWQREIVVEAELAEGRSSTNAVLYNRNAMDSELADSVSQYRYLEAMPIRSGVNPTVTFEIPNTLSAAYNIYCVFVPGTVANPKATNLLPSKAEFLLVYQNEAGTQVQEDFGEKTHETNPYHFTKVLVAENYKFPSANYMQEEVTVSLRVIGAVGSRESVYYNRNLMIDCIILEPVQ